MSAGGLARIGVRCEDPATGMATLGIYCGAFVPPPAAGPQPGGGSSKRPWVRAPGRGKTYELARYEDEEIIAVLQAMLSSRTRN